MTALRLPQQADVRRARRVLSTHPLTHIHVAGVAGCPEDNARRPLRQVTTTSVEQARATPGWTGLDWTTYSTTEAARARKAVAPAVPCARDGTTGRAAPRKPRSRSISTEYTISYQAGATGECARPIRQARIFTRMYVHVHVHVHVYVQGFVLGRVCAPSSPSPNDYFGSAWRYHHLRRVSEAQYFGCSFHFSGVSFGVRGSMPLLHFKAADSGGRADAEEGRRRVV